MLLVLAGLVTVVSWTWAVDSVTQPATLPTDPAYQQSETLLFPQEGAAMPATRHCLHPVLYGHMISVPHLHISGCPLLDSLYTWSSLLQVIALLNLQIHLKAGLIIHQKLFKGKCRSCGIQIFVGLHTYDCKDIKKPRFWAHHFMPVWYICSKKNFLCREGDYASFGFCRFGSNGLDCEHRNIPSVGKVYCHCNGYLCQLAL